jgi:hypothetical protein
LARAERHIETVTGGTAAAGPVSHPEQASERAKRHPPAKELTMRHAVVNALLIHEARTTGPRVPERARVDAPAEAASAPKRRRRRLATRLAGRLGRRPTTA